MLSSYEKFQEIGRGCHATVFEGHDARLGRPVAIKQLHDHVRRDARLAAPFWEGARLFARLSHEHLIRVYDVDESQGWIVLERLPRTLSQELQDGKLDPERVREVVTHLLAALAYLHRHDLMHGEVRLENLLCDAAGSVKLNAAPGIRVGQELRRPHDWQCHVAPEILNPRQFGDPGKSADLYYVGLIALELLTGPQFPRLFKGVGKNNAQGQLAWVQWHAAPGESLPPLKKLVRHVPDDLARVVDRLLKKFVAERYASADEALADLAGDAGATAAVGAEPGEISQGTAAAAGSQALAVHAPPVLRRSPTGPRSSAGSAVVPCWPWPRHARRLCEQLKRRKLLVGLVSVAGLFLSLSIAAGLGSAGSTWGTARFICLDDRTKDELQATVWMNDRMAGTTNDVLRLLDGDYDVEINVQGYLPYRDTVRIVAGGHQDIPVSLQRWSPPPPPPPPPPTYEVTVTAIPENAEIRIQAEKYSGGLAQVRLPAGRYRVRIERPGYTAITEELQISENARFHYELQPVTFRLELLVEPSDAVVFFDGRRLEGESPYGMDATPGPHRLRISREGYEDLHETIEVVADDVFPRRLMRKPEAIRMGTWIESDPGGATIEVNGQDTHAVTPANLALLPGPQQIRLIKPGFQPLHATVRVERNNESFFWYLPAESSARR